MAHVVQVVVEVSVYVPLKSHAVEERVVVVKSRRVVFSSSTYWLDEVSNSPRPQPLVEHFSPVGLSPERFLVDIKFRLEVVSLETVADEPAPPSRGPKNWVVYDVGRVAPLLRHVADQFLDQVNCAIFPQLEFHFPDCCQIGRLPVFNSHLYPACSFLVFVGERVLPAGQYEIQNAAEGEHIVRDEALLRH